MFGLLWFELDHESELSTWTMCQGKNIIKSHPSRHKKKGDVGRLRASSQDLLKEKIWKEKIQ